ncbi:YaaC family protein [Ornithinibacillus xuwenensis]|uniref:YaaC family protein n=1 Tax=Ornithinibacillus xuwenensis TaxID=3144668 RepID=A0ABU9XI23_9BACI
MQFHDIDSFYTYLQSQQTAQKYLLNCYKRIDGVDAEVKSYENCNVFLYYLEHGRHYYEAGKQLDMVIKPVMFFYGMAHLLKASILTIRPNYPESTTVLAHGVSTRKRKKKNYTFLEDEVKIQHNGLFPYFSEHLFKMKNIPFEKITMNALLKLIPELIVLFQFEQDESLMHIGEIGDTTITIHKSICDDLNLTENAFMKRLEGYLPSIETMKSNANDITIQLNEPFLDVKGPFFVHSNQSIYIPKDREYFYPLSEIMIHYLLLYNLSMLSRYEAEWWGDLLTAKPDLDYPLIKAFLSITQSKIPLLIGNLLYQNK